MEEDLKSFFEKRESVMITRFFTLKASEAKNSRARSECLNHENFESFLPSLGTQ